MFAGNCPPDDGGGGILGGDHDFRQDDVRRLKGEFVGGGRRAGERQGIGAVPERACDDRVFVPFQRQGKLSGGVGDRPVRRSHDPDGCGGNGFMRYRIDNFPEERRPLLCEARCDEETGCEQRGRQSMHGGAGNHPGRMLFRNREKKPP